jgi:hypothetical protein
MPCFNQNDSKRKKNHEFEVKIMIVFTLFQRAFLRKSPHFNCQESHVIQKASSIRFSQTIPTYAGTDPDLDPQQRYWQSLLVLLVAVIGR